MTSNIVIWGIVITLSCSLILVLGKYQWLDKLIKVIMVTLAISSVMAVSVALIKNETPISLKQVFPESSGLLFLIAFLGWMPAPLDISIWHSIWTIEKNKTQENSSLK